MLPKNWNAKIELFFKNFYVKDTLGLKVMRTPKVISDWYLSGMNFSDFPKTGFEHLKLKGSIFKIFMSQT